jgi:hypothetical protein
LDTINPAIREMVASDDVAAKFAAIGIDGLAGRPRQGRYREIGSRADQSQTIAARAQKVASCRRWSNRRLGWNSLRFGWSGWRQMLVAWQSLHAQMCSGEHDIRMSRGSLSLICITI